MQKLIIIKYGELTTKKDNINFFLKSLKKNVEYALSNCDKPIGVATYKIHDTLPEQMKDLLPSPEEIKKRLEGLDGENSWIFLAYFVAF